MDKPLVNDRKWLARWICAIALVVFVGCVFFQWGVLICAAYVAAIVLLLAWQDAK